MDTYEHLWEEEEEDSQEESDSPSVNPPPELTTITPEQQEQVENLLSELQVGKWPTDNIAQVASDISLSLLNDWNFLHCNEHTWNSPSKERSQYWCCLQVCIRAMAGAINFYLDPKLSYTWQEASLLVTKSQGHGSYQAHSIQRWIHKYLTSCKLPLHFYSCYCSTILENKDIAQSIQLHLVEIAKNGYICT